MYTLTPLHSTNCLSRQFKQAERKASPLSQYASDAIRMVESHSVLKQDKAPIRSLEDSDHSEARYTLKHH